MIRKTLLLPPDWWDAISAAAKRRKMTVSEWIAAACAARLNPDVRATLTTRRKRGRRPRNAQETESA